MADTVTGKKEFVVTDTHFEIKMADAIESRARFVIAQKLQRNDMIEDGSGLRPGDDLAEVYGVDSLEKLELMIALESEFKVEIHDDVTAKIRTVQDVFDQLAILVKA